MSELPPAKPWEINRTQNPSNFGPLHSGMNNTAGDQAGADGARKQTPPPVPTRPSQRTSTPVRYQPMYGGYSSYPTYGTGYGSMYGGGMYGGYGGMYGNYNRQYGSTGGFASQAEESTRSAFQSVESIVRAFTSISAMLESTFGAVYSSFRAVLDVADNLSRMRATFADILSSITIFRLLRFLYRRAKALLRLDTCDEAWDSVSSGATNPAPKRKSKSWPILLFVSVVIGGPYLIWKLLSGTPSPKQTTTWASGEADHVVAQALYSFDAEGDEEISIKVGDMLNLAPKDQQPHIRDWLLASADGANVGMVPANYVKILGRRRGRGPQQASDNAQSSTT